MGRKSSGGEIYIGSVIRKEVDEKDGGKREGASVL